MDRTYNKYFFDEFFSENAGDTYLNRDYWCHFFEGIAKRIIEQFHPKTVLDAGCASGYLVEALRNFGVEAYGIDISEYAISMAQDTIKPYLSIQSITEPLPLKFPEKFDMIVSIEVLEHMFPEDGKKAIELLCSYTDTIIFTSTPSDIDNKTHVNVQQREYWVKIFSENSFYRDLIQPVNFICDHAMLFRRADSVPEIIFQYELVERVNEGRNKKLLEEKDKKKGFFYFNFGSGFSEDNKSVFEYSGFNLITEHIKIPLGCTELRLDPIEGNFCIIGNLSIISNIGILKEKYSNSQYFYDGIHYFFNTDPNIVFDISDKTILWVQVSCNIVVFSDITEINFISKLYERIIKISEKNLDIISQQKKESEEKELLISKHQSMLEEQYRKYEQEKELLISKHQGMLEEQYRKYEQEKELLLSQQQTIFHNQDEKFNKEKKQIISKYEKSFFEVELQYKQKEENLIIQYDTKIEEYKLNIQQHKEEACSYKEHYFNTLEEYESIKLQMEYFSNAYYEISHAQFWRITYPIRKLVEFIKSIFKNRFTHLIYKGLLSLKKDGIKKTSQKVKNKLNKKGTDKNQVMIEDFNILQIDKKIDDKENNIKFSILVPLYNTPKNFLCEMIQSVIDQTYTNWELCLADGSDEEHSYIQETIKQMQKIDSRILYKKLENNLGISENTNSCAKMATGDFIAFLDHDDILASSALLENMYAIKETNAEVLYSDEDHLSVNGKHINPFYKPDWSPDLLYSQMYICHFLVVKRNLFEQTNGFRTFLNGSQDYDLMLRLSEYTNRICHIPKILYTWRECEGSTAADASAKPYAHNAGKCALDEHLKRKYGILAHAEDSPYTFVFDARFEKNIIDNPLISIIIPMKDKWEMTNSCIQSILEKSTYKNFEILLLDNRSEENSTKNWLQKIQKQDSRIKVIFADIEFNWSKLNNFGISHAQGDIYIFLNNDTLIITPDWMERLSENALREEIGVVGALLLYEDGTIQHAGVVVGINGWADHIFKGTQPIHYGSPFVSPMVSRNVLAVTGACMAISKKTIQQIGLFDENFIICGSDVEICIRAYENGLFNRYDANVRLYHLESKSRDSYIPEIDFKKSYECYTPYRENIDPFFNINLDLTSVIPKEKKASMNLINFKNFMKRYPLVTKTYNTIKQVFMPLQDYNIPEIGSVQARIDHENSDKIRLNLLIPSIDYKHVFGGISTAIKFFEELRKACNCDARIITLDAPVYEQTSAAPKEYYIVKNDIESKEKLQLVSFCDRHNKTIPVRKKDIFVATAWWTAYVIKSVIDWQKETFNEKFYTLFYLIQDYEPGFYAWSSRYLLADSTYRFDIPTFAIINSSILKSFFDYNNYKFYKTWYFEPILNETLSKILKTSKENVSKKKQILVYGRPSVERNAFGLLIAALKLWRIKQNDAKMWTLYSAGEEHADVDLGDGVCLKSLGKLSLQEYADTLLNTYAGISLMVSPHPSYPPLEMAAFGVKTITNCYANKDLSNFSENIISLSSSTPLEISDILCKISKEYNGIGKVMKQGSYIENKDLFGEIILELSNIIENL